jgi:DNA invertase Pin-like site-specific DNA recombinase
MSSAPKLRCAVYTRKSSEEGLDQEFNSLDAQREACVAYISSQGGLGWKLIPDLYDDGGISGGTMERPALQRLLQDIRDRRVDVVVVYKIDRLTRSLMDFSRIVEIFDANGVSFVSVTQAFNTTSSMGRLTLNVLLSFAQFEREVTAERIRDKIAASRKKGMWMGGRVPFGYQVKERRLVINEEDARNVRHIFERYLHLRSVLALTEEVNRAKIGRAGEADAPAWTRGKLYYLLANQIYVGNVRHHDRYFAGDHEAIIDTEQFGEVQKLLAIQAPRRARSSSNAADLHRLTGILFDETGDRLSPAHASNHGKRYRYYVSARLKTGRSTEGWRVPATELEAIVDQQIRQLLGDQARLASWVNDKADAGKIEKTLEAARDRLAGLSKDDTRILISQIVRHVALHPDRIEVQIDTGGLLAWLDSGEADIGRPGWAADIRVDAQPSSIVVISTPISIKRRGVETRLVIGSDPSSKRKPDAKLVDVIMRAHLYLGKLTNGAGRSVAEVADLFGVHSADVSRILPLAFLAPKIVEKILNGTQPADLTIRKLARVSDLPLRWSDQEAHLLR